jgi:ParB family chromosome partitioning protein
MDPQALEELAQSIKAQGVMQPIVVRPIGGPLRDHRR